MTSSFKHAYAERILTVDNVSVAYGENKILDNVSFKIDNVTRPGINQGQVVSLLGPSGMGKTQLFRCISGLQKQTSGTIKLGASEANVGVGDVGVVMQHYPLLGHRKILNQLELVAKGKAGKDRAKELLERFGLYEHKDKYPIQLSGGQRQRVAIIQQLLCEPEIILMDEPFSGLDPIARMNVCKLILEISMLNEANTIIVITHDIDYSLIISDTVLMLGRDTDTNGNKIPGAKIQRTYNLIERDLAWHPDIEQRPAFIPTLREIKNDFIHM